MAMHDIKYLLKDMGAGAKRSNMAGIEDTLSGLKIYCWSDKDTCLVNKACGSYTHGSKIIIIKSNLTNISKLWVLAHEISHFCGFEQPQMAIKIIKTMDVFGVTFNEKGRFSWVKCSGELAAEMFAVYVFEKLGLLSQETQWLAGWRSQTVVSLEELLADFKDIKFKFAWYKYGQNEAYCLFLRCATALKLIGNGADDGYAAR